MSKIGSSILYITASELDNKKRHQLLQLLSSTTLHVTSDRLFGFTSYYQLCSWVKKYFVLLFRYHESPPLKPPLFNIWYRTDKHSNDMGLTISDNYTADNGASSSKFLFLPKPEESWSHHFRQYQKIFRKYTNFIVSNITKKNQQRTFNKTWKIKHSRSRWGSIMFGALNYQTFRCDQCAKEIPNCN